MAPTNKEYILGTDSAELDRLHFQHKVWVEQAYAIWTRAGFRKGDNVLDLGCGPGFTSLELATLVGSTGKVIARDQSASFLEFLRSERERRALHQIEPSLGPVEELELRPAALDGAYARWLFCWLPDAKSVLAHVARALKSGGVLALQEYVDWAAMSLVPRSSAFDRMVAACMASWDAGGGTMNIGAHLPEMAQECGLTLESFQPVARMGGVGSLEWRWLTRFFDSYVPKVVEAGLLSAGEHAAFRAEWEERTADGTSYCLTPTMVDAVLRAR